jgi:hypothetical protein
VDDRIWKNLSIVLGIVCAVLLGIAGALMVIHKDGSSGPASSPDSSAVSEGSQAPTDASACPSGSACQTPGGSQGPSGPPAPTPKLGPSSPATITFTGLALDAANDKSGTVRTFTFISDGPGPVTYAVTNTSAGGSTKMCAKVDAGAFGCKVLALPNFLKGAADADHNTWTVTLVGYGNSHPTVDVTFTWPAVTPKITLNHGRFQGSSSPNVAEALNGFSATFKPRAAGPLNVQASWTTITTDVEMSLSDVTTSPAVTVDHRQYSAVTYISPAYNYNVDPTKTYLLKLRDTSADSQRPDLTAQITFP